MKTCTLITVLCFLGTRAFGQTTQPSQTEARYDRRAAIYSATDAQLAFHDQLRDTLRQLEDARNRRMEKEPNFTAVSAADDKAVRDLDAAIRTGDEAKKRAAADAFGLARLRYREISIKYDAPDTEKKLQSQIDAEWVKYTRLSDAADQQRIVDSQWSDFYLKAIDVDTTTAKELELANATTVRKPAKMQNWRFIGIDLDVTQLPKIITDFRGEAVREQDQDPSLWCRLLLQDESGAKFDRIFMQRSHVPDSAKKAKPRYWVDLLGYVIELRKPGTFGVIIPHAIDSSIQPAD